jgi:dienelactone hydrolase
VERDEATTEEVSLEDAGVVGTLALPADDGRHPAVLVLGGSDGARFSAVAKSLANEGYVALALSYFKAAGLPDDLANIPLEYFETALHWLGDRPEVDADQVFMWGASRGGEAALLVSSTYPDLVHAVVGRGARGRPGVRAPGLRSAGLDAQR